MKDLVTILIADNNETNRKLLHELILSLGYIPTLADNGLLHWLR